MYEREADALAATLGVDGIAISGRRIAVIDSGDGLLALALASRLGAASVHAFDDDGCNTETLGVLSGYFTGQPELPGTLRFLPTRPYEVPGEPDGYDLVVWWGDVGTRRDTVRMLREIARLVAPQGHVLLRAPASGTPSADVLGQAVLAAGLATARLEVDAVAVRPDLEQRALPLSALALRGARLVAFRPLAP
ncbi:MAG TPA: hypothetical protein VNT03_03180 [Baekduia sp.]|nr:hypothetical protein [Baekduia sp.]